MKAKDHLIPDMAIIGMACRFPCADHYDQYWQNIVAGRNCIREVPPDRWDWRQFVGDSRPGNNTGVKWGGFIDDIDRFDPLFFGISPSEAAFIDPQHRLFLETAWHAVEDAGYSVASLSGKAIGVYAGVSKNDYAELMRERRHGIAPYISTGTVHSILANRVSFLFNLHGRSEVVDTACSSSMVALHNAIRDIAGGECEAAIVGGVNALITPTMFISHSKSGMLSPDGQCRTFSADANGYVRSEGVGVLFIKPLQSALRDRDHVHAVIKSTAINHGGRSNFLTSPTTEAQAAVVARALKAGNIEPGSIDYIETHGTGTPLGDPIEINGLKKAFVQLAQEFPNPLRAAGTHCALSAVKTNVGHLESASGMAGIIKVVMAMKHRQIPAIRNFDRLNPYIELEGSPFYIATETAAWKSKAHPRRAGVSSFGMGGVNAHVVLEEAPAAEGDPAVEGGDSVIVLSARKGRLKHYAASLLDHLTRHKNDGGSEQLSLRDVAYTLQTGRDLFDERLAVVAASLDEVITALDGYVRGDTAAARNLFVTDPRNESGGSLASFGGESPVAADVMAAQWVRGAKVDWSGLDAGRAPRRVSLPTYPFERRRCWFTDVAPDVSGAVTPDSRVPDAASDGAARTLRATDFFIRDHVVQGRQMLPAAAHLEFARAAGAALPADPQRTRILKDVYWIKPVVVESEDLRVDIKLATDGGRVNFEIVQNDTIYSRGSLATGPLGTANLRKLDLAAVRSRCRPGSGKAELYGLFKEHGLAYGSTFQVIESYVHNAREILAELKLPEEIREGAADFVLHPSIMDGVFQTVTALSLLGAHQSGRQFIPFHLESAEILKPTGDHCFVYATLNEGRPHEGASPKFNATLCDPEGSALINIQNLQKRPIAGRPEAAKVPKSPKDIYYRPVWSRRAPDRGGSEPRTLVLFAHSQEIARSFRKYCGTSTAVVLVQPGELYQRLEESVYRINPGEPADYERLLQELKSENLPPTHVAYLWGLDADADGDSRNALEATIYGVLALTQAAFKLRLRETVNLVYVHSLEQGLARSVHSMIAGFARTLNYENPKFTYVTVGIDEAAREAIASVVCTELSSAAHANTLREVMYRDGQRYERNIVREPVPQNGGYAGKSGDLDRVIQPGGVYVVSGGAGGLGSIFSRYLAEKYGATILWLGRSAMSAVIAGRMADIEKAGGKCEYFSVDITDREALSRVFSQIKTVYREIHGVIHAAGLIEDAFILRKQKDSFRRVVEPKVLGAINLDAMTQHEDLGFFIVFSSIASLMPNQGQCDYAAANSFLDSFAEYRNRLVVNKQRSGVSLALNWPLWAQGGIRVTAEEEQHLAKVFGMAPLATSDGLTIFETSLALAKKRFPEIHQVVAIDGDEEKIGRWLGLEKSATSTVVKTADEAPNARLENEIKSIFAERLGVEPHTIDAGRTLGELGVSSTALVGVTLDLNKRFDADLKPTLLFDINTIRKLAAYLAEIGKNETVLPTGDGAPRWNRSLIDVDQSDPAGMIFRKTFETAAFYLRDHVVDGQYNMPGACYVEMARQACDLALGDRAARKLLNNYWASPLSSPKEDFTAHVHLTPKQGYLAYEIVSYAPTGEKQLHAMGQIAQDAPAPVPEIRIDFAQIRSRCDEIRYPDRIYGQIRSEGLIVGPTFQPMKQIFLGDAEALAMLELPEEIRTTIGEYSLNPALLTGAFQAALISNKRNTDNTRWYIPIGMDELEIFAPLPPECYVYCRPRPANTRNDEMKKFDLEICGPDGVVVVRLKGFAIRALKEEALPADSGMVARSDSSQSSDGETMAAAVQDFIRSKLAGPIGLPAEEIDVSVQFDQYGVTSVMVVELNQTFEDVFGPIPKTLFFEYRNIAELAEYFIEQHGDVLARIIRKDEVLQSSPAASPTSSDVRIGQTAEIGADLPSSMRRTDLSAEEIAVRPDRDLGGAASAERRDGAEHGGPSSGVRRRFTDVRAEERRDIAIVSAAGRFPGARNLEEFWDVLREGRDCITEIPPGRFNYRQYYDADPEHNGIYSKWGGFIDDVDRFDPAFFNISPREAELIDPQERLLLEVVWEMLERAGYTRQRLHRLSDRRVGVFVGALWQPYESVGIEATHAGNVVGPSSLLYSIANRVSYFLDLAGPSMAIDTACSSSLAALHLACQSIRNGESRFAIVAGVNLSLAVSKYLFLARNRFLSTDGRCRSYGAGGDGYVPGEGICAVLLKPLANAIEDADSILAVIKGSATNHGGRTNGYTVPSPKAQASVIAQALEQADIDPNTISYIEGHGTGTSLGDPVEIEGLEKALGRSRDGSRPCAIGSVKSNIGHLEAAAGVASVIKVILQMQNGQLVPSLHAGELNPNIDFGRSAFRVQRDLSAWPRPVLIRDGKREQGKRRAGVSSFGAGGSNAHVILEEYDGPPAPALRDIGSAGPALCVFSARTEERLFELVRRFRDYLRGVGADDLHDLAYTLQLGREAMRERLAVVAGSVDELKAALAEFLEQRPQRDNWRRGRVAGRGALADGVAKAVHETSPAWWKNQSLSQIAEAWVQGREVDWTQFHGGRSHGFMLLPTYPFAKERYWIDSAASKEIVAASTTAVPHPLLHSDTSDLSVRRYSSTFTGEEFFFADHLVRMDGRTFEKVLPGVACLEMARAAIERAFPTRPESMVLELRNTIWAQPIVVSRNARLSIALSANSNDQIEYRIYSQDAGREIVHCQGRAVWSPRPEPATLDIGGLERQMGRVTVDSNSVYAAFLRTGGVYGPSFQGIVAIHQGSDQLLAYLRLPKVVEDTLNDYVLHPSVMDSALQGYLGLVDDWFGGSGRTRMPFALESLTILSPCTREMVAWMRYSPGSQPGDHAIKLDLDLCDDQGRVCVRIKGFGVRALSRASDETRRRKLEQAGEAPPETTQDGPVGLMTLAPLWDAVNVEAGELNLRAGERIVVIGGEEEQHDGLRQQCGSVEVLKLDARATVDEIAENLRGARIDHVVWILPPAKTRGGENEALIEALIDEQEEGVLLGFRLIKALLSHGYGAGELRWTVITNATQRVGDSPAQTIDAAHSSIHGLVGSMAKEYRNWKVRLADVSANKWPWSELLRLDCDERGDGWAYREGQWYRRRLVQCDLGEGQHKEGGPRRGGVYVVIGGAGGVGEVASEFLIRKYDARIVWIGRRQQDEEIARKQERAAAGGGARPLYIAADARKREELERACREIKERYGRIDGVIHSAIVLSDKSLANMTEEQFRSALSTKVDTAVRLEQVFGHEPLDFILYFSSLQTFLKAPGQSNYAAGCTFTDAFAEWQSANAAYPVKVMNWGYWGGVGIVTAAEYQERMARMGWGSLEPEEGMAGLERLLRGPLQQAGMIRTNSVQAARTLGIEAGETIWIARGEAPSVCERMAAGVAEQEPTPELRIVEEQRRDFDEALAKMLWGQIAGMAADGPEPRVAGDYARWLKETLRILAGRGYMLNAGPNEFQLWIEWESNKSRWEAQGMSAPVRLVETTLRSLVPILRGEKRATDVMFPSSSLALVEGIYKNDAVADHFNDVMVDVVRRYVEERKGAASPKLRLLELGAGTGGSSQAILRKLDAYRGEVEEYRYTDVSKGFVLHGETTYGAGRDYLQYAVVDVEKGLQEQGIERGAYDVVLAANVLHATRRLRDTLRNAKAALKANGLLVLNEITAKSVFMHLTFGLLSGWWAYEDEELRMDGNPGLTPQMWKRVLEEEGFRGIYFPAHAAQGLGQQIIVAESDGIIRQKRVIPTKSSKRLSEAIPSPTLEPIPSAATARVVATEARGESALLEKVEAWLIEAVGVLLKVKREDVDLDSELSEFGFDSISLTGLANHVNQAFALELMPTIFFEHPTIKRFARYLVQEHGQRLSEKLVGRMHVATAAPRAIVAVPANDSELRGKIEQWLLEAVGVLLKVKREEFDLDAELSEFGFDSISLTGFANYVNQAFALELMPTIFFEYPTVRTFAAYLVDKHRERLIGTLGVATGAVSAVAAPRELPARAEETKVAAGAEEAIAIIGMSGRFPGADDLDAFWENLAEGRDNIREIPPERWDWRALDVDHKEDGAKWGAFIEGVDRFDPLFFGISPREAERIDPQHRLTMMYGWKAFEDAGYGPKQLWGSRTGIFIGTTSTGYSELAHDRGAIEGYTATGIVPSVGPNRLSFLLNLHGPSEPIETACSSSLVAVNRAVRSIMAGECEMALVGGVNTLFPTLQISFNKAGMLSPDGKCKTFSSRADGYARGEGVGMVVLKKLSAAERDGDHIYGLIRASAENHGGRAQSLTAPNPIAQAEVIKDAYRRAGVSPGSVGYIEAHGTGTPLGDPIEINGLKSAFQSLYEERGEAAAAGYCGLGSVKTNIGHLELAAGIAGLIKILLQLKHKTLLRSLHCDEVNPYIRLEDSPFFIVRENQPWKRLKNGELGEWPRRAGVSSFGFGGVNAHVVVEEYVGAHDRARNVKSGPVMMVLSAKSAERLKEQARQLRQWIASRDLSDQDLAGMAYTLQVGREAMDHRLAMTVASMKELEAKLDAFLEGRSGIEGLHRGEVKRNDETLALFRGDEELLEAAGKWMQRGKWSKLLELWVKGLDIEWEQLYGEEKPGRVSLPTYPFASERCWIDPPAPRNVAAQGAAITVLHPLLHRNTSDFSEQRYSSTFTGEEFFLTDHQIRGGQGPQKVLPGVAYLEMARAAIMQASPNQESSILELRDAVWLKPIIVTEPRQVSITLSENSDGRIDYEIYSVEAGQESVHSQGQAVFSRQSAPAKLDVEQLRAQMRQGRLEPSDLYAMCTRMGLLYGPAHHAVTAIHLGDKQLLAELRLPAVVETSERDYGLHPSVMDGALQAALALLVDLSDVPERPVVPFAVESLRVVSACMKEMMAWVRYSEGYEPGDKTIEVDIDLCDRQGNVCAQIVGFASRALESEGAPIAQSSATHRVPVRSNGGPEESSSFDDAFYRNLIADIADHKLSIDEAVEVG